MSLRKYILVCFSLLAIACGTDPGQANDEKKSGSVTDTLSKAIHGEKKNVAQLPPSLQQKYWTGTCRTGKEIRLIRSSIRML